MVNASLCQYPCNKQSFRALTPVLICYTTDEIEWNFRLGLHRDLLFEITCTHRE